MIPLALSCQISEFPFEILSKIFRTYIEDLESLTQLPHRRCCEGPLLLSRVSQYWRAVAISTPEIWSTLYIDSHLPYASISRFLALAKESPLTLYISLWSCGGGRSSTEVLNLLLSRIARWRLIQIWVDEKMVESILHGFGGTSGGEGLTSLCEKSVLEEVTIKGGFDVPPKTSKRLLSYFLHRKHFPHLRRLHWSLDFNFFSPSQLPSTFDPRDFDWEKLTFLSITSPPPMSQCLQLLQRCKNLQSFNVDYRSSPSTCLSSYPDFSIPDVPNPQITPPKSLRELTIKVGKPALRGILTNFTKSSFDSVGFLIDVSA